MAAAYDCYGVCVRRDDNTFGLIGLVPIADYLGEGRDGVAADLKAKQVALEKANSWRNSYYNSRGQVIEVFSLKGSRCNQVNNKDGFVRGKVVG